MQGLCKITEVTHIKNHELLVAFNDGLSGVIDFAQYTKKGVFKRLQNLEDFRNFGLERGVLAWKNGLDIAPEFLYSRLLENSEKPNSFSYFEQY